MRPVAEFMLRLIYELSDQVATARSFAFNEDLQKSGVLLGMDGLHPPSMGARVTFSGGKPKVTDGPFAEAKEVLGGYWIIQAHSLAEAVEWARRAPMADNEMIEIRQIMEISDFEPGEAIERHRRIAEQIGKPV